MKGLRWVLSKAYTSTAKPASSSTKPVSQEAGSSGPAPATGEYGDSDTIAKPETGWGAVQLAAASCPVGQLRPGSGWPAGLAPIMEEGDLLDRQIISGTSKGAGAEDLLDIPRMIAQKDFNSALQFQTHL